VNITGSGLGVFALTRQTPPAPAAGTRQASTGSAATAGQRRCTAPPALLTAGLALRSHPASALPPARNSSTRPALAFGSSSLPGQGAGLRGLVAYPVGGAVCLASTPSLTPWPAGPVARRTDLFPPNPLRLTNKRVSKIKLHRSCSCGHGQVDPKSPSLSACTASPRHPDNDRGEAVLCSPRRKPIPG
jgi:hypothetical protein